MKITKLNPTLCPIACEEITRRASFRADGRCVFNGGAYLVENGEVWHIALQGKPAQFENIWTDAQFGELTQGKIDSFNSGMAQEGRTEGEFFHGCPIAEVAKANEAVASARQVLRSSLRQVVKLAPFSVGSEYVHARYGKCLISSIDAIPHEDHGALWDLKLKPFRKDGQPGMREVALVTKITHLKSES